MFCSLPLLFVYLRMRMSSNPRSIAGVPFHSAEPYYCLRSCCNWSANCVMALQTKNQKPKEVKVSERGKG